MVADSNLIFTSGKFLSNLTDMRDGVPANFTTPSVSVGSVGPVHDTPLVARFFVPAYTNRSPGSGVGIYTAPIMTLVLQGNGGNPATEAGWVDVCSFVSVAPNRRFRPHIPAGDGSGTPGNPIYSNIAVARFVGQPYTNYRISGQYLGSFPDFSAVTADLRVGVRKVGAELL